MKTTIFLDDNQGIVNNIAPEIAPLDNFEVSSLRNFLMRPVLINQQSRAIGSTFATDIDPWNLFCNSPPIKKKLDNYAYIKGKLHLKVVINASPFHYGMYLIAYKPLAKAFLPSGPPSTEIERGIIQYSQCPHIYVYPQTGMGGEMVLPYINYREWLPLTLTDLSEFGTLTYITPIPLRFANTGTGTNVEISTYAWMEGVEVAAPSRRVVQSWTKDLTQVASDLASKSVGKFTNHIIEGLCNEPEPNSDRFTPASLPGLANTDGKFPGESLTFNPHARVGLNIKDAISTGKDELEIANFVAKESWLTYFQWSPSAAVNSNLFTINVTPNMLNRSGLTSLIYAEVATTPLFMVANMFSQWRGTIKIRMKFLCSQYHRGRVRIQWDPVTANDSLSIDDNVILLNQIVDISDNTDITFEVPYFSDTAWLDTKTDTVPLSAASLPIVPYGTGAIPITSDCNGQLTVKVLNILGAPNNTAQISVAVFVSGGDDMQFNNPAELNTTRRLYARVPQSEIKELDEEHSCVTLGGHRLSQPTAMYETYTGDKIINLRSIMQRLTLTDYHVGTNTAFVSGGYWLQRFIVKRVPVTPGYSNTGINTQNNTYINVRNQANTINVAFVPLWTPLTWISQCFIGQRGSIQHAFTSVGLLTSGLMTITRRNTQLATAPTRTEINVTQNCNTLNTSILNTRDETFPGAATEFNRINASVRALCPYYSIYKFHNTSPTTTNGYALDNSLYDNVSFTIEGPGTSSVSATNPIVYPHFTAAGSDYSPMFFLHSPLLYWQNYAVAPGTSGV